MIPSRGNVLLHVDEHADLGTPRLRTCLEELGSDLGSIASFTYSELDIGNFIWPAVYLDMVDELFWLRSRHSSEVTRRRMFIRPINEARTEFVTGIDVGRDTAVMTQSFITTGFTLENAEEVILDIDLDYFCSNVYPDFKNRRIEITYETWKEFTGDPYHFLRLAPGSRITAAKEGGRYFLYFNRFEAPAPTEAEQRAQQSEILTRMDRLMDFLERNHVRPRLIMTCRSRLSGYTPAQHCDFIETNLWERLTDRYDCCPVPIQAVLAEVGARTAGMTASEER
jgi:hypothetical protein